MKILENLGNNRYMIEIEQKEQLPSISIAHDYVRFYGQNYLTNPDNSVGPWFNTDVTIQIRTMQQVILPLLNQHEYMQQEHLGKRKDGSFGYTYFDEFYSYYKDGQEMVAVRLIGEREFTHVTKEFYNKFIGSKNHNED